MANKSVLGLLVDENVVGDALSSLRKVGYKDNEFEVKHINNAELRTYNSIWGHCVANPGNDKDFEIALDQAINDLLT